MENLFRGIWYTSSVTLEEDAVKAIPPFSSYDPFKDYVSASKLRQEGDQSLYMKFLSVNSDNPDNILEFCGQYGLLGNPLLLSFMYHNQKKPLYSKTFEDFTKEYKVAQTREFHEKQIPSILQQFPMRLNDFRQEQKELSDVMEYFQQAKVKFFSEQSFKPIEKYVNKTLGESSVELHLKWNPQGKRWELLWSSLTLIGYLTLMLMLDLLGPGKVISCPKCHKFFITASNQRKFCSPSCYGVFKVQKYQRKKKVEELVSQKGKGEKGSQSAGKK